LTLEKDKVIADLQTGFEAERKTHQKEIKDLQSGFEKEREAHEKTVKDLQAQIDKMFTTIENLAKQAIDKPNATTTINTNNVKNVYSDKYFLDKLTHEDIKHKCRNYLTEQVFFQGQRGIARMCTEHIIHTKDNKVLLTCTDVSRKKFKYIDEFGNIKEDYDARAFMEKVIGPIKQVSQEVYENILSDVKYEREELEHKKDLESMERKTALHYKTDMAADCYRQIIFIDNFENVIVNINKIEFEETRKGRKFSIVFKRDEIIDKISESYADVPEGDKLAFFNSAGYLEIAVNKGNAASLFGLQGFSEKQHSLQQQYMSSRLVYQSVKVFFE
jgi:S-adenosylmethionine hydrolase